jgi:hypothetical protein
MIEVYYIISDAEFDRNICLDGSQTTVRIAVPDLYNVMDVAIRILIGDEEADVKSILINTNMRGESCTKTEQ